MRRPREFPAAVGAATPLMAALYLILGGIGYWARGEDAPELIIFGMGTGPVARAASAAILLQVLAGSERASLQGQCREWWSIGGI